MSCCTNTYDLGCHNYCSVLSFGESEITGTVVGLFSFGNISVAQSISAITGEPFVFDLSLLNENAKQTIQLYNSSGNKITQIIDDVVYDCFTVTTQIYGGLSQSGSVTPASDVYSITIIGDGTEEYQSDSLIGATILFVTTDSAVRIPTDYSLDSTTGTLTFIGTIDLDTVIQIIYKWRK